ncbi:MAG: hypothetical protein Hens3KO_27220 [Henriciella sp.]
MTRALILSAMALCLSGPALAGTSFTAEREIPISQTQKYVAAKALWSCHNTVCKADLNHKKATVSTCKKLVRQIGKVQTFSTDTGALSEKQIKACNKVAAK